MKKYLSVFLFLSLCMGHLFAQQSDITATELKGYVQFLASDSLKGRKPGTPEINIAAEYIRDHFRSNGLKLAAEEGFQWFEVVTGASLGDGNTLFFDGYDAALSKEFTPLSWSANARVKAPVLFLGYGFDIQTDSLKWSDYSGMDVKGKWIMIFRGDPEPDVTDSKFIPYSDLRSKVLTARDQGAGGILLVTPRGMEKEDKLMTLTVENNEITAGIPIIHVTRELAGNILSAAGKSCDSLERFINRNKTPMSFETGLTVNAMVDVRLERMKTANVIGILEAGETSAKDEYLVVGGHYDHLGFGGPGSGSRMPDTNAIHNGADDNASGTAMVMALAKHLAAQKSKLKRSIIFVAFSSEEMGLLGSKYFVDHPPVDRSGIKAMFNFDMVGRFDRDKNAISVSGTGTSSEGDSLLKTLESGLPFSVIHSPDGYGPSDHAAFYAANIPVFYFNTGVHTDYHTPFDDTEKLDFETSARVGDFASDIIMTVDTLPKPLSFRESGTKQQAGRMGRRLKVTLGIMPDFAGTEKAGLRIDGVTKDGPADKGGMLKGDIIIAINGMKVENIYEYMARLQKLKHGMTVNVEVIRNGKNEILIIQL